MAAETSQTLDRGLRVLEILADGPAGLTVTEIANALEVSRTIVYRLVVTLEQHGFLRRAHDGRCRLGMASLSLARQIHPVVRDAAVPSLRRLAETVGATAHLTLVEGSEALAVAVVEPTRSDMHLAYRVGARAPVDRGVAGRAAVATRASARALEPGWVISGGDPAQGGYAVAAPVLGVVGFEASVGVLSMVELDAAVVGPRVVAAAADIGRALR
jgi:hypothetical protein